MRVVISQPNYIPWRGYFDAMDDADLFLLYDDVQYTSRDWRNRNCVKTQQGLMWLTVPVSKTSRDTLIKDIVINYDEPWQAQHRRTLTSAYGKAPFFHKYADGFFELLKENFERLVDLDVATIKFAMMALDIQTPIRLASELGIKGSKTTKLIDLVRACGGGDYLSGPSAKAYIDPALFSEAGIGLAWKSYDYPSYPQLWGEFEPKVSILDLLFNCGPQARGFLKSRKPNERVLAANLSGDPRV